MAAEESDIVPLALPRIGTVIAGAALFCPALAMPLVFACLAALGTLALEESRTRNVAPKASPASVAKDRLRRMSGDVTAASEDSFPASDPPSWTPVTGTGTRH